MSSFLAGNLNVRSILPALLWAMLGLLPLSAQPSIASPSMTETTESEILTAPVLVDGKTLFSIRGVSAYPPETRARQIAARIVAVASNPASPERSLRLLDTADGTQILAGNQLIMMVVDADALLEGVDRQVLAQIFMSRIQEAIDAFRRDREPAFLIRQTLHALAATVVLLLGILLMRRVRSALEARYRDRIRAVRIQSLDIIRAEQLWHALSGTTKLVSAVVLVTASYLYLDYVLFLFPWTRGLANNLYTILTRPLETMGRGLLEIVPNVVFLVILILVARYVLVLIRLFFAAIESGAITLRGFEPVWSKPTERLVRVAVIILALVVAYPYIPGSNSQAFKGVSVFIGLLVSLGSASLIGNIIAGYTMTYRRTFRTGDRVKIGEHTGFVEESRLLATFLRTFKNELVVVPNSKIINEEVVNYSTLAQREGLILHTTVSVGYDVPWRQVEAMLLEAASRTSGLLRNHRPFVLQKMLGGFAVTYELNAYCDKPRAIGRLYSRLHQNILDVFNEYGVQIMTPSYESDPEQTKVVPRDKWYAAPAGPTNDEASADPNDAAVSGPSDDPSIPRAS
jgi:small-conductance mechanosensitive channel